MTATDTPSAGYPWCSTDGSCGCFVAGADRGAVIRFLDEASLTAWSARHTEPGWHVESRIVWPEDEGYDDRPLQDIVRAWMDQGPVWVRIDGNVVRFELNSPHPAPKRMSGAELLVRLDRAGLSLAGAARVLDVRPDTVRKWTTNRDPIPYGMDAELRAVEDATAAAVARLVVELRQSPVVAVPRGDVDLWAARPQTHPWPVSWWRMVIARATTEVPGVDIVWAENAEQEAAP